MNSGEEITVDRWSLLDTYKEIKCEEGAAFR